MTESTDPLARAMPIEHIGAVRNFLIPFHPAELVRWSTLSRNRYGEEMGQSTTGPRTATQVVENILYAQLIPEDERAVSAGALPPERRLIKLSAVKNDGREVVVFDATRPPTVPATLPAADESISPADSGFIGHPLIPAVGNDLEHAKQLYALMIDVANVFPLCIALTGSHQELRLRSLPKTEADAFRERRETALARYEVLRKDIPRLTAIVEEAARTRFSPVDLSVFNSSEIRYLSLNKPGRWTDPGFREQVRTTVANLVRELEESGDGRAMIEPLTAGELPRQVATAKPTSAGAGKVGDKPRRGRLPKDESKAKQAHFLAKLREHPSMKDDLATLAGIVGVSESTARNWLDAEEEKYRNSRTARADADDEE